MERFNLGLQLAPLEWRNGNRLLVSAVSSLTHTQATCAHAVLHMLVH